MRINQLINERFIVFNTIGWFWRDSQIIGYRITISNRQPLQTVSDKQPRNEFPFIFLSLTFNIVFSVIQESLFLDEQIVFVCVFLTFALTPRNTSYLGIKNNQPQHLRERLFLADRSIYGISSHPWHWWIQIVGLFNLYLL